MVVTRSESSSDGWEKTISDLEKKADSMDEMINEVNIQILTTNERISTLGSHIEAKMEAFMAEIRAALAHKTPTNTAGDSSDGQGSNTVLSAGTPPMTIPTFNGPEAMAWLARAEQYFLVSNVPSENRVNVAMVALAGPALPWFQLLRRRVLDLAWDHFT
ncbi:CTTNBP2 N-terminal-like protein [Salvia divinorum]|uniref:CTTNBP2 N-terminal-like protein n=1 Tax=Salvia divinorum TaxID=28513 RepID=A0ABD1GKG7_SALDI